MNTLSRKSIALLIGTCVLLSTIFGFSGAMAANYFFNPSGQPSDELITATNENNGNLSLSQSEITGDEVLPVSRIASLNANSVVEIRTEQVLNDLWMQQYVTQGAGSGVLIDSKGYIITNNHVIDGANKITVTLADEESYTAEVAGVDSLNDIAVLKISASGLTPAVYGDSELLKAGDPVVVIGNPLGELGGSVSAGIISALDRQLTIEGKNMTLLQTDASVNPGNSGGGMFNQKGELVGIVVAKSSGSNVEGLGFAIPVNLVKELTSQLIEYGYVKGRVDTGMTYIDLTQMQDALRYGVRNLGIYVKSVDRENAQAAGFESGDLIYSLENTPIASAEDLTEALQDYKVGDSVDFTVIRDYREIKLTLKLLEKK